MNKPPLFMLTAAALLLTTSAAQAAPTVQVTTTPGIAYVTGAIDTAAVSGADMGGLLVTVCNLANQCETKAWDGSLGGASGLGWSLTQSGDTFTSPFTFSATDAAFSRFSINGRPAGVTFDVVRAGEGSLGSQEGRAFELGTNISLAFEDSEFNAAYTDRLTIDGADGGDLFTVLSVDWGADLTGFFSFVADTDKVVQGNTITPLQNPPVGVPEPGSLALVGLALAAVGAVRRRKA